MPSPSWKPRSNADRCSASAGQQLAVDPDVPRTRARRAHDGRLDGPDRRQRPARLGDRLVPLVLGIAAPGDPAADVERQPLAVGDERPDQDARPHPPVRPHPQQRPAVRPAPDRLQALDQLHRPDLRRAGDAAAGERGREQVEGIGVGAEAAGDGRHEVLHGGRPLEAQQPRHADRPRLADPAEVVAEHVDDHHVLGLVLGARQQLAGEGAVLLPGAAARARALDRVGGDHALAVDRQERLRRRGQQRARRARWRATRRGRDSRRTAPGRRCGGAGTRATGRRRTGPRAGGSGSPGRCRRARWRRGRPRRRAARRRAASATGTWPARLPPSGRRGRADLAATERLDPRAAPPRGADRAGRRRHRPPAPPATRGPSGGPRPAPSRGGRGGARGRCWSTRAIDGSRSNRRPRS